MSDMKYVVITGAGGYLGQAFAISASKFSNCIILDKDSEKLSNIYNTLNTENGQVHEQICVNFESKRDRQEMLSYLSNKYPLIDALINNAAFTGDTFSEGWAGPFEHQSLEIWENALNVNLTSVFEITQKLAPSLRRAADGNVLNMASIYGALGPDMSLYEGTQMGNPAAYAASKGGLIQLTRWLATTLAPKIRVNCISPGGIFRNQPKKFVDAYTKRTPVGRMAKEDDIVGPMMFLTFGASQYMTGQNLFVDGGFSVW